MSDSKHEREVEALEVALGSLMPLAGNLSRDQVLFRAGQASGARRARLWFGLSTASSCLSLVMGVALLYPKAETTPSIVGVDTPDLPASIDRQQAASQVAGTYGQLRGRMLAHGADVGATETAGFASEKRVPLEELLDLSVSPQERPSLFWPRTNKRNGDSL